MPFGEFQYAMDDKGRVIVPPPFREFVEDGLVVTRGMEGCLYVFPLPTWRTIETRLTELPLTDADARNFVRFFYSGAAKAKLDAAGRVTVPATLRLFAGVDAESGGNVVVAGAPNRLELWNEARWLSNLAEVQSRPPAPELLRELVG
jgi:MraZ protein